VSLFQTFFAYSAEKKGQLTLQDFTKMLKRLDDTLANDELEAIFEYIDTDHSKTIEYEELSSYYCKVNGIPESLELPA
jgi:Ca2+-binding EF-hand superfamily protein